MIDPDDIKFMRRCLDLASRAEGMTYPNPMVGSVIVHTGSILGEGYHLRSGESHAEVNAINSVQDKTRLGSSTLYVNLEPCSHFGKTPPCADFIISHGIPRVVIGTVDTSDNVSGKGIKKLRDAGCEVETGLLENECRQLNRRFFTFHEKKRPYITLKWARSADGFMDVIRSSDHEAGPNWITGKPERILVHKWRASEQSILAGAGTIRADDPMLNVREWKGNDPLKLILSSSGTGIEGSILKSSGSKVILFTHNVNSDIQGAEIFLLNSNKPSSVQICDYLYSSGIQSLFIEGGAEVLNHFIATEMWDEARIFTGEVRFKDGVRSPALNEKPSLKTNFSSSTLEIYLRCGIVGLSD
jgi:diaminohydroxyphosphoribosylaminopyrimidine deaminase / 5-amino-6-(5-phosphoribosylamino)uracil reductase